MFDGQSALGWRVFIEAWRTLLAINGQSCECLRVDQTERTCRLQQASWTVAIGISRRHSPRALTSIASYCICLVEGKRTEQRIVLPPSYIGLGKGARSHKWFFISRTLETQEVSVKNVIYSPYLTQISVVIIWLFWRGMSDNILVIFGSYCS